MSAVWSLIDPLLGSEEDAVLARRFGVHPTAVWARRFRRGIPEAAPRPVAPPPPPAPLPVPVVRERTPTPTPTPQTRPPRLRLVRSAPEPAARKPTPVRRKRLHRIDWSRWDHLLGKSADATLAKAIGCVPRTVARRRRSLKIAIHGASRPRGARIDWEAVRHLLGTMPDRQLAQLLGVSRERVGQVRAEYGIPIFHRPRVPRRSRISEDRQ